MTKGNSNPPDDDETKIILYACLLATVVSVATHFILLRAPLTTDFSSWRSTPGVTYIIVIAAAGLSAAYLARTASVTSSAAAARAAGWASRSD